MKKSDTNVFLTLIGIFLIALIFYIGGYNTAEEDYSNQIADLEQEIEQEIETCEGHNEYCDGHCEHIEDEIENRVYDKELIYRDLINETDGIYDDDDMEESYWEGAIDGYVQGYGDCYYGNEQEYEIDEYFDEHMF